MRAVLRSDSMLEPPLEALLIDALTDSCAPLMDDAATHLEGVAVVLDEDVLLGNAHLNGKLGMGTKVNRLAVDRHEVGRMRHGKHELELLLATVTRNVHERIGLVVDLATDLRKRVNDALDGLLVAGNGGGGDDLRIVRGDGK